MLTVNKLFSGIGAQAKALERLGIPHKIVCTSDIDKDAILSYAAVHCDFLDKYKDFIKNTKITNDLLVKMRDELLEKGININPKNKKKLPLYWYAVQLSNNIGDISKIPELPYADMWTYSFPCQSISLAGRREGIIRGVTRSGLLYEVQRLLEKARDNSTPPPNI